MITAGTKPISAFATPAAGVLLVMLLTSCGGEGSIDLPSPSGSITASLPSASRTPSRSASQPPSESPSRSTSPTASESDSPTESETPEEPSAPASESPSEISSPSEPTEPAASSSPPAEAKTTEPAEDQGIPAWFWWVLVGLGLLGATVAAILVPRARRRSRWDTALAAQHDEVTWLAQELIPGLQRVASPDAVAGGWQVAAARVTRAEDQLTGLESTAPDEVRGSRARSLRDAVRAARQGIEQLIVSRDPAALPRDLTAIGNHLQAALNPSDPTR